MEIGLPGLGGRLRRARLDIGLSPEDVAEKIGVCTAITVHRWERSLSLIPDSTLTHLCDLYNRPLRWFLTLEYGDVIEAI